MAWLLLLLGHALMASAKADTPAALVFHCKEPNDLLDAINAHSPTPFACEPSLEQAIEKAFSGATVMSLAPGYPTLQTDVTSPAAKKLFDSAAAKHLRLYIEFPSSMPGAASVSPIKKTRWERVVVSSASLSPTLKPLRILNVHMVTFTDVSSDSVESPDLVLAKVAGYDVANFGLNGTLAKPLLLQANVSTVPVMLATTQLSNFVTQRFAPSSAWGNVCQYILAAMLPGAPVPFSFAPSVYPSYAWNATLPHDADFQAHKKAVDWYLHGRVLPSPAQALALANYRATGATAPLILPSEASSGDGRLGVLEGVYSEVREGGEQPTSLGLRADCNAETAMAFAIRSSFPGANTSYAAVSRNLLDFAWGRGGFPQPWLSGSGDDKKGDAFGLLGWANTPAASKLMYSDDSARGLLGGIATAAALQSDRWDSVIATAIRGQMNGHLLGAILANLRLSGKHGVPVESITFAEIERDGWEQYWNSENVPAYSPHYVAYIMAVQLWAFHSSGYRPLYDRSKAGISTMMAGYPSKWIPTLNGICMQRARMVLPLAWLVRVEDTPEHRQWLAEVVDGLLARQHSSGAFQEEISAPGWGGSARVPDNGNYGTFEAPLNQENSDPVTDLLYTANFALLGLHEAAAATGNATYARAASAAADFMIRAQAASPKLHPELHGAFFRAFDFDKWEVWASDADVGWGAWSVETGWTQSWISSILGLRAQNTSLWDLYESFNRSTIKEQINGWAPYFFPEHAASVEHVAFV